MTRRIGGILETHRQTRSLRMPTPLPSSPEDNTGTSIQTRSKSILEDAFNYGLLVAAVVLIAIASQSWIHPRVEMKEGAARKLMPPLILPQLGGETWRLQDHRGEVVLINFWATWCPPCRQETPGLAKLARDYQSKGLAVVGVSMDEGGASAIQAFVNEFHLPYPVAVPDRASPLASAVESLPTTILLDRQGRVARTYMGAVRESVFQADVDRLLAEVWASRQQGSS